MVWEGWNREAPPYPDNSICLGSNTLWQFLQHLIKNFCGCTQYLASVQLTVASFWLFEAVRKDSIGRPL